MANGQQCWAFGSTQYVRAALDNVKEYLGKKGTSLPTKDPMPMASQYCPEVDIREELEEEEDSYFHSLIGVLRWIVELG